jgi:flavin-dependent dehydrogenase
VRHYDAVVMGAGPAGALAARELARRGVSVLLLDRAVFPRPKVCGGCLSAGAVDVLRSVGLGELPAGLGARPIETLVLSARARRARLPLGGGYAISRSALDQALAESAVAEGAIFWSGARASLGRVEGTERVVLVARREGPVELRASVVLDATGLGGELVARPRSRIGLGASLEDPTYPAQTGELHMIVGRGGYVGLVRVESGALNVAAAVDPVGLGGTRPRDALATLLVGAGMPLPAGWHEAEWRGTPRLTRSAADVGGERLFRLGDANGYVEPFTGEGMCWAFDAAVAVAPLAAAAVGGWQPDLSHRWEAYCAATLRPAQRLCRALAPALRRSWLVGGAMAALQRAPGLAGPLLRKAARAPSSAVGSA